jgi:exopolysaccharide biosynthesis polyprenyl glycosylphosphotransferase
MADLVIVLLSWMALYYLRFFIFEGDPGPNYIFLKAAAVLLVISGYFFSQEGLYESMRLATRQQEILRILKANLIAIVAFIVLLYFVTDKRLSRAVMIGYALLSTFSLVGFRMTVRTYLRRLRAAGKNLRSMLLVGHGWILEEFTKSLQENPDAGIQFVAWIDSAGAAERFGIPEFKGDLHQARRQLNPSHITVGYMGDETSKMQQVLKDHFNDVVPITVLPDLSYSFVGYKIDYVAGLPALVVNQPDFSDGDVLLKRAFDFVSCFIGLLILSPLLLVLAILVKITSPGPIFFGQERIGLDGKIFKMWKFRSMKVSAEAESTWTVKDDPRRTPFGTFLRKTSLDELPQLWNVLVGDMSLVGPRPEQPRFVDKFRHEIPAYMLRHKMKAGITGWAQVNGWRGDTSLHERIACDLYYIKNWSLLLDLKILFLTFWKGFINKNAY